MNFRIIPARQLTAEHLAAWSELQRANLALGSPFFRPEFTQAVDAVRGGVEVAVIEELGVPRGFLPFQRSGRRIGMPVGSPMNDFQGAVTSAGLSWSPQELVRRVGLRAFNFDCLVASQAEFSAYQHVVAESHFVDLSQGYEHYIRSRSKNFRKNMKRAERDAEPLGELRVEATPDDHGMLDKLVEWKIDQCRRTGIPCTFARPWSREIIEQILASPTEEFSGMLWGIYLGDQLAAVQFTIRSGSVMHAWIAAFNRDLYDYSPGFLLDDRIARAAAESGIARIDLGKGDEAYKRRHSTGFELVTEGTVPASRAHAPVYRAWSLTKQRLRATPLRAPVRQVRRWTQSTFTRLGLTD